LQHHGHGVDHELAGRGARHVAARLAAIPAPYRERGRWPIETGKRIVEMVQEDLKPSKIMTRKAFENAIVVNSAIGGSTNAPIHLNAIARHIGVELDNRRLGEARLRHPAAGQPAAGRRISRRGLSPRRRRARRRERADEGRARSMKDAITVNGKTIGENCKGKFSIEPQVIRPYDEAAEEARPASRC
jgi:dihydroxy-acid dehydratase